MQNQKLLMVFIIILAIIYIGLQILEMQVIADYVRPTLVPLLTITYYLAKKEKSSNFFYFLLFYSIGEIFSLFRYFGLDFFFIDDLLYYLVNTLFITAYIFLILEILKPINIRKTFNRYTTYILILAVLDIYSVILVTEIAIKSEFLDGFFDYLTEIVYNIAFMLLLSVALINYISSHSKKAMNLLLGTLCIVFSEVMQVAYFYVSEQNKLSVIYAILLVLAFTFFYIQSNLSYADSKIYEAVETKEEI